MLAKANRVSRSEFTAAYAVGIRRHTPLFTVIQAPGAAFKATVVVSEKVAKKAHDRNRLRRRLYAVLESLYAQGDIQGTILIHAKPALASLTKHQFFTEVPPQIAQSLKSQ